MLVGIKKTAAVLMLSLGMSVVSPTVNAMLPQRKEDTRRKAKKKNRCVTACQCINIGLLCAIFYTCYLAHQGHFSWVPDFLEELYVRCTFDSFMQTVEEIPQLGTCLTSMADDLGISMSEFVGTYIYGGKPLPAFGDFTSFKDMCPPLSGLSDICVEPMQKFFARGVSMFSPDNAMRCIKIGLGMFFE